ncbi:hypothetical protein EDEG_00607 [Edhazardia aedis USNM 41457]|uniref:Uncharacterized protein n=1 Tax=Edhazardia aedis (strain USNM 41457) TaxID=1003232 RepID=J9DVM2_EDHAE|nr:hypothetical protein EDEG_00607 [Edhazardia aedis USNM 41457]|eukprot:EJW05337.1 hypothetical protein EDEG_00607 [Edhazardia aedis USNM 41457]
MTEKTVVSDVLNAFAEKLFDISRFRIGKTENTEFKGCNISTELNYEIIDPKTKKQIQTQTYFFPKDLTQNYAINESSNDSKTKKNIENHLENQNNKNKRNLYNVNKSLLSQIEKEILQLSKSQIINNLNKNYNESSNFTFFLSNFIRAIHFFSMHNFITARKMLQKFISLKLKPSEFLYIYHFISLSHIFTSEYFEARYYIEQALIICKKCDFKDAYTYFLAFYMFLESLNSIVNVNLCNVEFENYLREKFCFILDVITKKCSKVHLLSDEHILNRKSDKVKAGPDNFKKMLKFCCLQKNITQFKNIFTSEKLKNIIITCGAKFNLDSSQYKKLVNLNELSVVNKLNKIPTFLSDFDIKKKSLLVSKWCHIDFQNFATKEKSLLANHKYLLNCLLYGEDCLYREMRLFDFELTTKLSQTSCYSKRSQIEKNTKNEKNMFTYTEQIQKLFEVHKNTAFLSFYTKNENILCLDILDSNQSFVFENLNWSEIMHSFEKLLRDHKVGLKKSAETLEEKRKWWVERFRYDSLIEVLVKTVNAGIISVMENGDLTANLNLQINENNQNLEKIETNKNILVHENCKITTKFKKLCEIDGNLQNSNQSNFLYKSNKNEYSDKKDKNINDDKKINVYITSTRKNSPKHRLNNDKSFCIKDTEYVRSETDPSSSINKFASNISDNNLDLKQITSATNENKLVKLEEFEENFQSEDNHKKTIDSLAQKISKKKIHYYSSKIKKHTVFLICDERTVNFPFELLPLLEDKPVYRIPSIEFLLKKSFESSFKTISDSKSHIKKIKSVSYILDPENNLKNTKNTFTKFFEYLKKNNANNLLISGLVN